MITLITPTSSQPRFHRRAEALKSSALCPHVFYYMRSYYNINKFPENIKTEFLYKIEDGKYFKRTIKFIKSIFKVRSHKKKSNNQIAYAFSIDCALVALVSGYRRIIYEIGDIRSTSKLSQALERYIIANSSFIVVTSEGFKNHLEKQYELDKEKFLVLENKLSYIPEVLDKRNLQKAFSIGVIGFLRYEKPLKFLADFSLKHKVNLNIFGDGPYKEIFVNHPYASYHGPFKNPEELDQVYSSIDINYAVYDNTSLNVRLALPNKLYESMAYRVPLLVAKRTFLAEKVVEKEIGSSIDIDNFEDFEKDMLNALRTHSNTKEVNIFERIEYTDASSQLLKEKIYKKWNIHEAANTKS